MPIKSAYGKRKSTKTAKKVYKKKTYKSRLNLDQKIKSIVKRTVNKNVEVKNQAEFTIVEDGFFHADGAPIVPYFEPKQLNTIWNLITQGVGQGGRIGNKITVKGYTVAYTLKVETGNPLWSTSQIPNNYYYPQGYYIDVYIMRRRDGTLETSNTLTEFFQFGDTTQAPTTNVNDAMLYINKDVYNVLYKRRHKMAPASLDFAATAEQSNQYDGLMSVTKKVNLTKHIKSVLRYNDATAQVEDEPSTNIFMICLPVGRTANGVIYNQGNGPLGSNYLPINLSVNSYVRYTDA
jgi:hypothetical protein